MMFRPTAIGLITAVLLGYGCSMSPADTRSGYSGVVEGVVKDSSGQPLSGAFVKLENAERRLTFMVISQDQGRYRANKLPAGRYTLQGVGNGFQSEWSDPVEVSQRGTAELDLSLTDPQAPMLPAAWPRRIPEEQTEPEVLPEGAGKEILPARCVSCHAIARIFRSGRDRDGWQKTIDEMRAYMRDGGLSDLTDQESGELADYMAAHFPPLPTPDPNSRLPRTLMQGEARNYRVVQYELENAADTHDVAVDPDGIGWANQRDGGNLSRFDPETLEHSEVSPPLTTAEIAFMGNPQISEEGVIWLAEPNERRWLSYDIKAAEWTEWDFPTTIRGSASGNTMALHPDGTIWLTGSGSMRRLNPLTKEWSSWDTPTWTRTQKNPGGYGATVAGDGRVWFALDRADLMSRVDPKTGEVDEFEIPVEGVVYPRRMDTDREGNVWVALWRAGKLMKIDQHTAEMTLFDPPTPPYNGAYSVSVDRTNDLVWVTLHRVDKIARFNPKTNQWVEFPLPQAETDVRRIEVDQNNPNRLWWSSSDGAGKARIGFVELLDNEM